MIDETLLPEDTAPELAQDPTQAATAPTTPAGPPDYKAKRTKFIGKFAELDPEAKMDEPTLAEILADKQKGPEFTKYVNQLNPDFSLSADELATELGYGEVKKKPGGNDGSTTGAATPRINPAQMQSALGIQPEDAPAPAPSTAQLPTAQEYPDYLRAHPDERAKLIEEEAKYLGEVPEGYERVRIPDDATGPDAPGTYQAGNSPTGQRYIDRPLSKEANGAQQSEWQAAGANLKNQLLDMGQGGLDYLGAADRRLRDSSIGQFADEMGAKVGLNGNSDRANVFQDGADAIASQKSEVAPFYAQSKFHPTDPSTYPMAVSNVAALAAPALVSVLLPEGKVAQGIEAAAGLAFDSQMMEGSFVRAKQAGLTPGSPEYDNYTLADATATVLVFKLGAVGLGAVQQQALKSQLLQDVGEQLRGTTTRLSEQALSQTMQKAAQRVAQTLKGAAQEGAQMGTLMAANTVKEKVGERVANQQLGRAVFPQQSLGEDAADVGRSFGEGALLGGITGGIRGAGQPVAPGENPRLRPFEGTKPLPAELPVAQARGRKVLTRDAQGHAQLGEVQDVVNAPEGRAYVVRNAEGKLSRHAQGEVFTNNSVPQPTEHTSSLPQRVIDKLPVPGGLQTLANAEVLNNPAPRRAEPTTRSTATDPGPTADNQPRRATPRPAEPLTPQPTSGPTLGELVPDATPITLDFGGELVQAFRNAEGDVELHHAAGNVSVISKGEAFDKPAVVSSLSRPQPRVKAGDTLTLGSGEFATELPIEDVHRDQSGQIAAVMVEGKTGSRIIEGDTPEGKAALAELNAREQQVAPATTSKITATEKAEVAGQETPASQPAPAYASPAENRKAGRFTKDGQTYTRQEPLAERALTGKETTVRFATREAQPARFALVEAADLQPSHTGGTQNLAHFLPEAQPKNRSNVFDKASQKAIDEIATQPDARQLGDSPTAYAGAPVVNSRGEVIQGNGRGEGIRQHYKRGGKTYRADILAEAQRAGIDPKGARSMKEPVLVRVADVSDARAQQLGSYTAADTESGGTRRLEPKQAVARLSEEGRTTLARLLTPEGEGTLSETIRAKQDEVVRFLQKNGLANDTQLQTLVKGDGTLTPNGVEDIANLHRQLLYAGGDPNLPELFQELPGAAQSGIDRAVGALAGLPQAKSITFELQNAIAGVYEFRQTGLPFEQWLRQQNVFDTTGRNSPADRYTPLEQVIIRLLAEEKRPTYIARMFGQFAAAARGEKQSLFDAVPALSRAEAVAKTFNVADATPRERNPAGAADPTSPGAPDGRPTAPEAPGMASPAEGAKPGAQSAAATTEQAGRPARQQLAAGSPASKREQAIANLKERRTQREPHPRVEEYTQAYELRPNEPESIRETGHAALAETEKAGRKGRGRVLPDNAPRPDSGGQRPIRAQEDNAPPARLGAEINQLGISAEMREKGHVSFVGLVVETVQELAEMMQVHRDPRFETFHYYFVKDIDGADEIVGEQTITSRMPGSTPVFPDLKTWGASTEWLKAEMEKVGADGYWMQHNHPSGDPEPSPADMRVTKRISKEVPGFRGHIIINHKTYKVLWTEGDMIGGSDGVIRSEWGKIDPLHQPALPGPLLGRRIVKADELVNVAKELEQKDKFAVLVGRDARGQVVSTGYIPLATLGAKDANGALHKAGSRARAAIRAFGFKSGALNVILAGLPKPTGKTKREFKTYGEGGPHVALIENLVREGYILDALDATGRLFSDTITPERDRMPMGRVRVREQGADYNGLSADDLADYRTVLDSYVEEGTTGRKKLTARFRADVGSEAETNLSDAQLRSLIGEAQDAAGLVPKAKPAEATKERAHATRYDEATRKAFTEDEARYTPKKLVENQASARDYIQQVGLDNAYAVALDKPEGFPSAAHVETQEGVATEYRRLSDEARKAGDKDQAEAYWQRAKDVRAKKVSALTDAAQTLSQAQTLIADSPESVLDAAIKTTEAQRKPLLAKAEKEGVKVAAQAIKARRRAMDATLKSEAVRRAREQVAPTEGAEAKPTPDPIGYGQQNKYFTKVKALQAKEALRKLGLSTIVPPELVSFVGYHVEALARAGGKHSFAEVSKRVVRELGAKVKPLLPEAYAQAQVKYLSNGGKGSEKGFTSPEEVAKLVAPAAVKSGIRQLGATLDKIAREHAEGVNMKGKGLAERFATEAGIDPKQAKVYADAIESEYAKQITARKKELAHKVVNFTTRVLLGRNAATAVDKLLSTLNLATDPASAGELLKAQLKLPDVTPEKADEFVKLAEAVRTARAGNDRANKVQDLIKALGKLENVSYYQVAEAVFYASALSGPLTHAANIASNAKQATAEALLSTLTTLADTGDVRAAALPLVGAWRAQRRAIAEATRIISTGYVGTQSEKFGHQNVLENANNSAGLKYVSRALVAEDAIFNMSLRGMRTHEVAIKQAYREVTRAAALNGEKLPLGETFQRAHIEALGKLFGIADMRAAAESQADAEGLTERGPRLRRIGELVNAEVEKQQAKWAAQADAEGLVGSAKQQRIGELQEMSQSADLVADAKQFAELGTFNNSLEGTMGAVADLVGKLGNIPVAGAKPFKLLAPFTRILSSVVNRRLDWGPVGILRAVKGSTGSKEYQGGRFYRELTPEQRERVFLSGTLGTLTTIGLYALAKAGYVTITPTGYGSKDDKQAAPPASIRWGNSGLFVSYQGDPNELGFAAIGNLLEYEAREAKAGRKAAPSKRLAVVAALTASYATDLSPVKGIGEGLEALASGKPDRIGAYFTRMGAGTAKTLLPYSAAIQQSMRGLNILMGENDKEAISDGAWEKAYNSLLVDVPVWRDSQEDAIDLLGNPIKLTSTRLWGCQAERSDADQQALEFLASHDLVPTRPKSTDPSLAKYDASTGKMRVMNGPEFKAFMLTRGKTFGELLRGAMLKPSLNPAYPAEVRAVLRANPAQDLALPDMDPVAAKKLVAKLHKRALAGAKIAAFGPATPPTAKK